MTDTDDDIVLDLNGVSCPMPVFLTAKKLKTLKTGQILRVIASDPMAEIDIPHLVRELNYQLLSQEKYKQQLIFRICKNIVS